MKMLKQLILASVFALSGAVAFAEQAAEKPADAHKATVETKAPADSRKLKQEKGAKKATRTAKKKKKQKRR